MKLKVFLFLFFLLQLFLIPYFYSQDNHLPKNPNSTLERIKRLYEEAKFDEAISVSKEFLKYLESKGMADYQNRKLSADIHMYIGFSLIGKEEKGKAIDEFKKMINLNPYKIDEITADIYGKKITDALSEASLELNNQAYKKEAIEKDPQNVNNKLINEAAKKNNITQLDIFKQQEIESSKTKNQNLLNKQYTTTKAKVKYPIHKIAPSKKANFKTKYPDKKRSIEKLPSTNQINNNISNKKKNKKGTISNSYYQLKKQIYSLFKKKFSSKKSIAESKDKKSKKIISSKEKIKSTKKKKK